MNKRVFTVSVVCLMSMGACSNKFETMPADELADKMYECRTVVEQAPGMAIRCDNIRRECKRRRDEGHFVC